MDCKNCKYYIDDNNEFFRTMMCSITHRWQPKSCNYIENDEKVKDMEICFNCKHWIGAGDWGLSCEVHYHNCSVNGFDEACELFEREND